MDFQIVSFPAEDFDGDIILALSIHSSSFRPSGRLWTTETWPKAHCEVTDQVGKLSVSCKYLEESTANNGVKPHTDKNKQVADNRQ